MQWRFLQCSRPRPTRPARRPRRPRRPRLALVVRSAFAACPCCPIQAACSTEYGRCLSTQSRINLCVGRGACCFFLFCSVCLLRARSRSLLTEVPSYPPVEAVERVGCRAHGSRVSLQLRFVSLKSAATMPLPLPYACACKTLCPRCYAHAAAHPDAHAMIRLISARSLSPS